MNRIIKLRVILIVILFSSCEKKLTDLEFEKNVMTEIFPSLIDSTCIDMRMFFNPPPIVGEILYDKEGNHIGIDSTKGTKEQKQKLLEWKMQLRKIEKDTSKIIVAFDPLLKDNNQDLSEDFEKHFNSKIFISKEKKETEYIFDFKKIKLDNKFLIKDIAQFPKDKKTIWKAKYDFIFGGVVSFSRIQFDKNRQFGILDGGFVCGRHCGQGFRIYIKKINNKWIIDEVEGTWVA
ncbi:hypothetical protein [Flavobacterium sp. MDT1-60]|uniref:hypothetical protein n=1 Tax=Flavobacterium sp. MDT1-60 TaxID=1979344 RepID=UPI0017853394|nr:hypothetical protein [Flavobacterium sp. MDT1-60]QOG04497.1 hypothetical protein IHE43_09935 [Flavobacterium sp. MDT1-60]